MLREVDQQHKEDHRFDPEHWRRICTEYGIPTFDQMALIDVEEWRARLPLKEIALRARGNSVRIETGGLPELLNPYLNTLILLTGGPPGPIGRQFIARPQIEQPAQGEEKTGYIDSLIEDEHEVVPGLIHKYPNRVLMLVTEQCAAYCRYCTRGRRVGTPDAHPRSAADINACFDYIKAHPEVEEVIFSGGDSFIVPEETFTTMVNGAATLEQSGQLMSVRFGTRSIIHNPATLRDFHLRELQRLWSPNVMLRYNHPYELTVQSVGAVKQLLQAGARLHSQSVLLKGVNNDRQTLENKDRKGHRYGINPYYDFICDEVAWAGGFLIPFPEIVALYSQRRAEMAGLAGRGRPVIDVPNGKGKIPIPEGFWMDDEHFVDFEGTIFRVTAQGMIAVARADGPSS